jgi:hypothetical protein
MARLFARASVEGTDAITVILGLGGWLDKNYIQFAYQLAHSCATFSFSFVVTVGLTCRCPDADPVR